MSLPLPHPYVVKPPKPGESDPPLDAHGVQKNLQDLALAIPNAPETAWSTYRHIFDGMTRLDAAGAATYIMGVEGVAVPAGGAQAAAQMLYIDPADYTAGSRVTKYRVRANLGSNATASTVNFTVGLYPVTAVAGGAAVVNVTLGAVTAGSTVAFNAPALSTRFNGNSGDFAAPAAGYYIFAVVVSGAMAAGSSVALRATLQMRQA